MARLSLPWADLVGPNSGLLEACYRHREVSRPIEVGDIVRIPTVGRFVCLTHGWGVLDEYWTTPLDARRRPTDDSTWALPGTETNRAHVIVPATDAPDLRVQPPPLPPLTRSEPRSTRKPRPPRPRPGPLSNAATRLRKNQPPPGAKRRDPR